MAFGFPEAGCPSHSKKSELTDLAHMGTNPVDLVVNLIFLFLPLSTSSKWSDTHVAHLTLVLGQIFAMCSNVDYLFIHDARTIQVARRYRQH